MFKLGVEFESFFKLWINYFFKSQQKFGWKKISLFVLFKMTSAKKFHFFFKTNLNIFLLTLFVTVFFQNWTLSLPNHLFSPHFRIYEDKYRRVLFFKSFKAFWAFMFSLKLITTLASTTLVSHSSVYLVFNVSGSSEFSLKTKLFFEKTLTVNCFLFHFSFAWANTVQTWRKGSTNK